MTYLLQSELAARGWAVHLAGDGELFVLTESSTGTETEAMGLDKASEFLEAIELRQLHERVVA